MMSSTSKRGGILGFVVLALLVAAAAGAFYLSTPDGRAFLPQVMTQIEQLKSLSD